MNVSRFKVFEKAKKVAYAQLAFFRKMREKSKTQTTLTPT